jgi:hypothetical protein
MFHAVSVGVDALHNLAKLLLDGNLRFLQVVKAFFDYGYGVRNGFFDAYSCAHADDYLVLVCQLDADVAATAYGNQHFSVILLFLDAFQGHVGVV